MFLKVRDFIYLFIYILVYLFVYLFVYFGHLCQSVSLLGNSTDVFIIQLRTGGQPSLSLDVFLF